MSRTVTGGSYRGTPTEELRMEVVPPEGVPLVFTVAMAGDRIAGFLLDALLIVVGVFALFLLGLLSGGGPWLWALLMLLFFLLRNGYFILFEMRWQGRTPGKRWAGLRVLDAGGRPVTADAIVVRNLTREVELVMPLSVLSSPEALVSSGPGWLRVLAVLWVAVFLLFPLFNRQRRRIGDLLAGTVVVRDVRRALERELAEPGPEAVTELTFTDEQLRQYGVYELQVLEDLLRDGTGRTEALELVAKKVKEKIGWTGPADIRPRRFLEAFYRAQRARLERDLLLGTARERKRGGRSD